MKNELEYPETIPQGYVPIKMETFVRLTHLAGITERLVNNEVEVRVKEAKEEIQGQYHIQICNLERDLRKAKESEQGGLFAFMELYKSHEELKRRINKLKSNVLFNLLFKNRYL